MLAPVARGLVWYQRTRTATYLAERSVQSRPIRLQPQLLNYKPPGIFVVVLGRNFLGRTTIFVLRLNIRLRLEDLSDAPLIPSQSRPV